VSQREVAFGLDAGAALEPIVMGVRNPQRLGGGAREDGEKIFEHLLVEARHRRKLPQDGAQLWAQLEKSRGQEVGQRRFDAAQLEHVRDVTAALDRKHESLRRMFRPLSVAGRPLQRIERAIELDRGENARGVFQLARLRQPARVEVAPPRRVAPARNADTDRALAHTAAFARKQGLAGV
jgi:hypothetical protein